MSSGVRLARGFTTSSSADWTVERLAALKGTQTVAVVIPARDEERTVGHVVTGIFGALGTVIDELVVIDSMSVDETAEQARRAGAVVHSIRDIRPDLGVHPGKGEAIWKSLFVVDADVIAFIDADLTDWGPHFVTGTVGPLLADPGLALCRGFYDRDTGGPSEPDLGGGRVTELVARPWLALHRPELAGIVQPLAGEWAVRRDVLRTIPIPVGYGVELATLIDACDRFGPESIAQVDLGRRGHRHRPLAELSVMAVQVLAAASRRNSARFDVGSGVAGPAETVDLCRMGADRDWHSTLVDTSERPPHAGLA